MFDVLTMAAIAEELSGIVIDRPVRTVGLVDKRTLALGIFARGRERWLIASVDPENSAIVWTDREPAIDAQLVTPFLLLLRKHVRGGVVAGLRQPPLERVIQVSIAKRQTPHKRPDLELPGLESESDVETEPIEDEGIEDASFVHLSIELMGRRGNIILFDDDDIVMESIKRVTVAMSRVRPIAPRVIFTNPPPQRGYDPRAFSSAEARAVFAGADRDAAAARVLTRAVNAMSPVLAEETIFRAVGDAKTLARDLPADSWNAIARETRHLFEPLLLSNWRPTVYRDAEGEIVEFSAQPLTHLTERFAESDAPSMLAAVDAAAREAQIEDSPSKHAQRRARLVQAIARYRERVLARFDSLKEQQRRAFDADLLRRKGELIYAYIWMIRPGQSTLEVEDETIELDSSLSASENAQRYFEQYRKLQSADEQLPRLIADAENELRYLNELTTLTSQATRFEDIEAIALEWDRYERDHGARGPSPATSYRRSAPPKRTRPFHDSDGFLIYLGRSGSENDRITFDIAGPDDYWLHARGTPGSHVIVRTRGGSADEIEAALRRAASLAAHYSGARASGSVEVDIAKRRDVRKIKGAGPGMVTYRNERTIAVRPASESELGLTMRTGE